jgi:hypothetical protein
MAERKKRTLYERFTRLDTDVSLSQWAYDRIAGNWQTLVAVFVAGGGMTYLAAITDWAHAWGPLGIGAVGLAAALAVWIGLALGASIRAKATLHKAHTTAIEKWKEQVDSVNPLASEFHTKRLRIADISHPISNRISNKRMIDCELVGPANLVMIGSSFSHVGFMNCDIAVARDGAMIQNAILLENVTMIGGQIWNCTIFIPSNQIPAFRAAGGNFISLTGVPEIDNQPPQGTQGKKQP